MKTKRLIALLLALALLCAGVSAFAQVYRDKDTVMRVQEALNGLGYDCGAPDGIAGKDTGRAISEFREDKGLPESEEIDDGLLDALGLNTGSMEEDLPAETDAPQTEGNIQDAAGGSFDEPALIDPEERYEIYTDETDGSDYLVFIMLDAANDEAEEIENYGALYITDNVMLNADGKPGMKVNISIQDSPYGKVIISETRFLWMKQETYSFGALDIVLEGNDVREEKLFSKDEFDYYIESYHFPYGYPDTLNGIRQDENGFTYYLIKSDAALSFEFVTGAGMRILETRVYERNDEGHLELVSFVDYETGPAREIPQAVLDAAGEKLERTA